MLRDYACAIWVTYFAALGLITLPVFLVAVALAERFWGRFVPGYNRFIRNAGEKYFLAVLVAAPFVVALFVPVGFLTSLIDRAVPKSSCDFNAGYGFLFGMVISVVFKRPLSRFLDEVRSPKNIWRPGPDEP